MSAALIARLTRSLENVRYIKEASLDVARVYDVVEATDGVMQVFAGERIVESFLLGAVGYVNPFGNYAPRASSLIWDLLTAGRIEEAKMIERKLDQVNEIIAEGHPTYGHQCYSKALAAVAGYPVGDVRPPLTTFASLGAEGVERVAKLTPLLHELDELADRFAPALAVPA
jgi:4-hydroxy-tetrahydrodipicolinate synthase